MDTEPKDDRVAIFEKHPLWLRCNHWLNFPLLAVMVWSGILIYWADPVYTPFFSRAFYRAIGINNKLALGLAVHFSTMGLFTLNGLVYLAGVLLSGHWRELRPARGDLGGAWRVMLHDLGLRRERPMGGKYNPAQRIAYSGALVMGALAVLSGISIYKPVQAHGLTSLFGGYEGARLAHFLMAAGFTLFFIVHVAQVIRAGWNGFRAMVAGFEVKEAPDER